MFFTNYRQFIPWFPQTKSNGKIDKIPIGSVVDPATWSTYEQAATLGNPGFVFTENDPFFFIDIDDCTTPQGVWSALAVEVCGMFPGCAVEVSHSGKGLHIFGVGTPADTNHRNKNAALGLELYTKERFVALTGVGATGSAFQNAQGALDTFVEKYMTRPGGETTGSLPGNDLTDEEVLVVAMRAKSARAAFGGSATFKELYEGNADALRKYFPGSGELGFDWSAADAALLSHLAFYTGCDAEQMARLFDKSSLGQRDKWRERPDYQVRSVEFAVGGCSATYQKRERSPEIVADVSEAQGFRAGLQLLNIDAQLEYFKDCAYVVEKHAVWTPGRGLLKPERFKAVFGGYLFTKAAEGKPTSNAFEAFTESQLYNFPIADDVCFRPEEPPGGLVSEEGRTLVNTYEKIPIEAAEGDPEPFVGLLEKLLPIERDRTVLLSYMAACVQYPGFKFQWAPVVQGTEGNGKTFLATALTHALGQRYSHTPNASDLAGNGLKFNGWLYGKLFIAIEDLFPSDRRDLQEALKPLITNRRIEFQFKGASQFVGDNRANFMTFCNYKDSLQIADGNRRYCPLYTAQQTRAHLGRDGMSGRYFPDLYEWARNGGWAVIAWYLKNYAISDDFNPAGICQRAPETSSSNEARVASMGPIEQEVIEAIEEQRMGFRGGWVSSIALDRLLQDKRFRLAHNKRREMMESLGYVVKERVNSPSLADDGKRPVLFVAPESIQERIPRGAETTAAYIEAQGLARG